MHCPSCYKKIGDDDRRCPHCGTSLSIFNPPSSTHPTRQAFEDGEVVYAGFWVRAAAHIIDVIVLTLGSLLLFVPLSMALGDKLMPMPGEPRPQHELLLNLLSIAIAWLYYALQESSEHRATLGKRLLNIQVTDLRGERLTFARATGRYFATILCYLSLFIGFIIAAFTARKQALHDMVADTVVTRQGSSKAGCLIALALAVVLTVAIGALSAFLMPTYMKMAQTELKAQQQQEAGEMPAEDGTQPDMEASAESGLFGAPGDAAAEAVEAAYAHTGNMPNSSDEAQFAPAEAGVSVTIGDGGVVTLFSHDGAAHMTMMPQLKDGAIDWLCAAEGVKNRDFPQRCQ